MAEMSQIDAQPWKGIWLENIGPECQIRTIFIIVVWPEAVAGMGHDWRIVRAAPRVKFCKSGVELATDLRSQPRIGGPQIGRLVEPVIRQVFVAYRLKSHRRVELNPDESARRLGRVADEDLVNLNGAAHDRHRIFISTFALMMVIESLSQRVESDEAMHARTVPAAGDPGHDVDLLFDAQLILVLEPFGEIDDRGRHQHDPRLLSHLAMKLIKLLGQLVTMAGIQEGPPNVTAEQIVA